MLLGRIKLLSCNKIPRFRIFLSSTIGTTSVLNKKCKESRESRKKHDPCKPLPVAVILCGCGVLDGTECSEALSAAINLYQKGMVPKFYAPDVEICETIDHYTRKPEKCSTRNALIEAARLVRSNVKPLCECEACKHKALVIPGGFGIAKTMSDFAVMGAECTILPDMEKLIQDFYCENKPIAAICISSVLVAKVLKGVKITLGRESPLSEWPHADAINKAKEMGAEVEIRGDKGITICRKYKVLSTPAWMYNCATFGEIHQTIGKMMTMLRKCIDRS